MTQTTNTALRVHYGDNIEYICERNDDGGLRVTAHLQVEGDSVAIHIAEPRVLDHIIDLYECVSALNGITMDQLKEDTRDNSPINPTTNAKWYLIRTDTGSIRYYDSIDRHSELWLPDEYEAIDIIDTVLARIEKHKTNYPTYSAPANSIALLNELMTVSAAKVIEDKMKLHDQE